MTDGNAIFPANYSVTYDFLPGQGEEVLRFKRDETNPVSGLDGPVLRIAPKNGKDWFAMFASGYKGADVVDSLLSTPNPDVVCVVARGAGYWLHVFFKTKSDVRVFPVRQVHSIAERGLILFSDFTRIAAYDTSGPVWITESLFMDDLRIDRVQGKFAECSGMRSDIGCRVTRTLNLETGTPAGE
jgi:hypothetical protein